MNTPIGKSDIKIEIIRSSRKTLAIEIRPDMHVIVRAPHRAPNGYIEQFISDRADWIVEHLRKLEQKTDNAMTHCLLKSSQTMSLRSLPIKPAPTFPGVWLTSHRLPASPMGV